LLLQVSSREQTLTARQVVLNNFPLTPLEFFAFVGEQINARQIPGVQQSLISRRQGGLLTTRRFYLHVSYQMSLCIVGASPFGNTLVISWRCGELPSWLRLALVNHPVLSFTVEWFLRPPTFYRVDLNVAFQQLVQQVIVGAIDQVTEVRGMRPLDETQRQHFVGAR
jgi:hypothetical protein